MTRSSKRRVLPGFGLTMGCTLLYLSLIVLIPLSAAFLKPTGIKLTELWERRGSPSAIASYVAETVPPNAAAFWKTASSPRAIASYKLSFGASLAGAAINAVFGFIVAWTLVRYRFPGRNLLDAMVDLPFALPTAVAGIALTSLYAPNGWIGQFLNGNPVTVGGVPLPHVPAPGIKAAYSPLGVVIALTFIGLPFVVRTVQPIMEELGRDLEEAALSLGASGWATFRRVVFPELYPAVLTGFTLAFARALGEYGSVVFISGNLPMKTEITPLLIVTRLEQYDYRGATSLAVVLLVFSFVLLLLINGLQRWAGKGRALV